jgi:hypothetical protein
VEIHGVPGLTALGVVLAIAAVYLASCLASGERLLDPDGPFGLARMVRFNGVCLAIIAFTIWAGLSEFRRVPGELPELRGILACDNATFRAALQRARPGRAQVALAVALGGVLGALVVLASYLGASGRNEWIWGFQSSWNLFLMVVMFGILGAFALWGGRSARLYSSLTARHARVDLLDPASLRLLTRRGLRLAFFWFGGSGIALLLAIDASSRGVVLSAIAGTSALGVASLVLSTLGAHRRLRDVKLLELARVRAAIRRHREGLLEGDGAADLPALLAWEARIASVSEWPFDAPSLVRFGLLLLIPVGSWLGGALVERLVERLLG